MHVSSSQPAVLFGRDMNASVPEMSRAATSRYFSKEELAAQLTKVCAAGTRSHRAAEVSGFVFPRRVFLFFFFSSTDGDAVREDHAAAAPTRIAESGARSHCARGGAGGTV